MKIKHKIVIALTTTLTVVALGTCAYNSTVLLNSSIHSQYNFQHEYLELFEDSLNKQSIDLDAPEYSKISNLFIKNQKNAFDNFLLVYGKQDIENFAAFKYYAESNATFNLFETDENMPASEDCLAMFKVTDNAKKEIGEIFDKVNIKLDKYWCQTGEKYNFIGTTIENQDDKKFIYVESIPKDIEFRHHGLEEYVKTAALTGTIADSKVSFALLDANHKIIESTDPAFDPNNISPEDFNAARVKGSLKTEISNGKVSLATIRYLPRFNIYAVIETPKRYAILKIIGSNFISGLLSVLALVYLIYLYNSISGKFVTQIKTIRKAIEFMTHNVLSDRSTLEKINDKMDGVSSNYREINELGESVKNLSRAISESVASKVKELEDKRDDEISVALDKELTSVMKRMHGSLLPDGSQMPTSKFLDISSFVIPSNKDQRDFYDIFRVDKDNIGLVIGYTNQNGIDANNAINLCVNFVKKSLAKDNMLPGQTVTELNKLLRVRERGDLNVSIFVMILSEFTGNFVYSIAGLNPPVITHEGKSQVIEPKAMMQELGAEDNLIYIDSKGKLTYGDGLAFVGQGIRSMVNIDKEEFTNDKLIKLCESNYESNATDQLISIYKEIKSFGEAAGNDKDILSIVVKRNDNNKEFD